MNCMTFEKPKTYDVELHGIGDYTRKCLGAAIRAWLFSNKVPKETEQELKYIQDGLIKIRGMEVRKNG